MEIKKEVIKEGLDKAYLKAGHNAYFGNGFEAGVEFALKETHKTIADVVKQTLKPCPICGENDAIAFHKPNKDNNEDVQCLKCGLKMEKALDNSCGAVAWWNKRS